jgi:MOSC domain-containing protein YiiM/GNAT superfamily N-acetyltransferase
MDGRVLQVNISPGGVPKLPVDRAWIATDGLVGDAHRHRYVHGGPHRAVALLGIEAIERVQADGHPIEPGSVGENLTTAGIELSKLPVGTRLTIGNEAVLELSGPANPCDVIKGSFRNGKSGRISILVHPSDSRMYARVIVEGEVCPGDPIAVTPPAEGSNAAVLPLLDLLDDVDRTAWLGMWRAAAAAGFDVRILDRGDLSAAACPDLPGTVFNRAFGLRVVPIATDEVLDLYRAAGMSGWLIDGGEAALKAGAVPDGEVSVHFAEVPAVAPASVDGLEIRTVETPADARTWVELFIEAFEIEPPVADAWRRFEPALAGGHGYLQFIAELHGRRVAVAATQTHRRVAWLGGGGVLPEARGQGIQRALIHHRVMVAATAGCTRAMATADAGSRSAANLEAAGLREIWRRHHVRFDPEPAS